jgi:plasmid replication initiation protein
MNTKKLTVCKANQLIEATYRLTLNEIRVINACIAQVDSVAPLLATDKFELSAKDFAKLFSISEDRAYSELQSTTKTLYERSLAIHNPDPTKPKIKKLETRWISTIGYMPEDGKIYLYFSQGILPFLSELKGQFTKYELTQISGMTCIYAYRLYELLMQWKSTGKREIEIEWLKKHFELDKSYDRMFDLKKRVIDPAVKDINEHSSYQVRWEQRKTGRKVTHLIFTFSEKKSPEDEAAKPKRTATPQEKMILGVPISKIMQESRVGESYEDAAARINHEKATKKPSPQKQKTAVPVSDLIAGLNKSLTSSPAVSPSADSEAHRISVINFFINKNGKEKYLTEFKEKGFVSIHGIGGAIIEADLKLAGLFD